MGHRVNSGWMMDTWGHFSLFLLLQLKNKFFLAGHGGTFLLISALRRQSWAGL